MTGEFTAYYLNHSELKNAIEINKRFEATYSPYILVSILSFFNMDTFEGYIKFADRNSIPIPVTKKDDRNKEFMQEYYNKKEGAFTIDGVRFFKIINTYAKRDLEEIIVFTFKYMNYPSYIEKNTAFMVMPFRYPQLNEFYARNIKEFLFHSELQIKVTRSDDFTGTDVVADTILEQIKKVEFIICDITNCNKNVFFEIGYAKGLNKSIIFILEQNKTADFFDVNHIRRIEYNYDREIDFQNLLRDTLITVRNTAPF